MTDQVQPGDRVIDGHYRALPNQIQEDLLTLTLNLAAEVWTLRDKLRLLQAGLDEEGSSVNATVECRRNDPDQIEAMRSDRDAFVRRLFRGAGEIRRTDLKRAGPQVDPKTFS